MLPINSNACKAAPVTFVPAALNANCRLINQWEAWARASEPGAAELRDVALFRLKAYIEANDTVLDLSALNLRQLPPHLPESLRELYLDRNCLDELPEDLPASLQILDVSNNLFTRLPEDLPASLANLYASDNQLTRLPKNLPVSLIELNVSYNQLHELVDIPNLLQKLNINDNQLTHLPENLPNSLQVLNVDSNRLTHLPNNLPVSLTELSVIYNQLNGLPENLPFSLETLDVGYNQLTRLPFNLPTFLLGLYASYNQLIFLPENLPNFLQTLDVSGNRLTHLPNRLPNSLVDLYASNNAITELPAHLPNLLRILDIDNNSLTYTPQYFTKQIAFWTEETEGWQAITKESHAEAFAHFLEKLNNGQNRQNAELRERVQGWLAYLKQQENRELRERTFLIADEATGSCVDRASFYFNQMYVQMIEHQLIKSAPSLNDLWLTNLGLFRLAELEKVAARQVQARRSASAGFDEEIEIYLAYQYKLRDKLSLPVYSELQFGLVANLSEQDVQCAEEEVLLAEKTAFIRYLVTESASWTHSLSAWDQKQKDALDEEYLSEIGSEVFARAVADELTALGLPADDSDGQRAVSGRRAEELWYQKRYRFSRAFLAAHQGLSLLDNFAHPGAE